MRPRRAQPPETGHRHRRKEFVLPSAIFPPRRNIAIGRAHALQCLLARAKAAEKALMLRTRLRQADCRQQA